MKTDANKLNTRIQIWRKNLDEFENQNWTMSQEIWGNISAIEDVSFIDLSKNNQSILYSIYLKLNQDIQPEDRLKFDDKEANIFRVNHHKQNRETSIVAIEISSSDKIL